MCFFIGIVFFYTKSAYPVCFLIATLWIRPRLRYVVWFLAAMLYGMLHQHWIAERGMPIRHVIKQACLEGYIASIPTVDQSKTQFQFQLDTLDGHPVSSTVLLSCYDHCPVLLAGERWQIHAKIKKPVNLVNPGGFDYVRFLDSRHVSWTGLTRHSGFKRLDGQAFYVLSYRQSLANQLNALQLNEQITGIWQALTLGVTNHINKDQWDLFRRTGTTHLMVISGAHIGLVAGFSYAVISALWRRMGRLCLFIPTPQIASLGGFSLALCYAVLAGLGVPAQRALILCFFMLLRYFCSQRFTVWQAWRYALCCILMIEPHSVLLSGFYLSFLAVAILIVSSERIRINGIKKTLLLQLACLVGLMPLSLYWFSYAAINGVLANLIAIPWVGFVLVPLSLFLTLLSQWVTVSWLTGLLTTAIEWLLYFLHGVDALSFLNITVSFTIILAPLCLMMLLCMLVVMPIRHLAPAMMLLGLAGVIPRYPSIKPNDASVDVLDVGQGLAVVIRTANHVVLYDTGMKFYHGGDMGTLAIIPYLKTLGIKKLDKIIISHPDLDHRGGYRSLKAAYPIDELLVDDPLFYHEGFACHDYPAWEWDGVAFRFFPIHDAFPAKNNRSCVLQLANKAGSVLLSGDIERMAEQYLVKTYGTHLASTVLIVPHHGSKTSSSTAFLQYVKPLYAIMSLGIDNRYHFPAHGIVTRYQRQGIMLHDTSKEGMIRVQLNQNSKDNTFIISSTRR